MERIKEYIMCHQIKWDDIYGKDRNMLMPRTNNYYLEGFWGLENCKRWIANGNNKGRCIANDCSKVDNMILENIFAVCKDNLVPLNECNLCNTEPIIVFVKTTNNMHRWKEVVTKDEVIAFIESFDNVVEVLACTACDIEILE